MMKLLPLLFMFFCYNLFLRLSIYMTIMACYHRQQLVINR